MDIPLPPPNLLRPINRRLILIEASLCPLLSDIAKCVTSCLPLPLTHPPPSSHLKAVALHIRKLRGPRRILVASVTVATLSPILHILSIRYTINSNIAARLTSVWCLPLWRLSPTGGQNKDSNSATHNSSPLSAHTVASGLLDPDSCISHSNNSHPSVHHHWYSSLISPFFHCFLWIIFLAFLELQRKSLTTSHPLPGCFPPRLLCFLFCFLLPLRGFCSEGERLIRRMIAWRGACCHVTQDVDNGVVLLLPGGSSYHLHWTLFYVSLRLGLGWRDEEPDVDLVLNHK